MRYLNAPFIWCLQNDAFTDDVPWWFLIHTGKSVKEMKKPRIKTEELPVSYSCS